MIDRLTGEKRHIAGQWTNSVMALVAVAACVGIGYSYQYLLEYNRYCNVLGIAVVIGIASLLSHNRRVIDYQLAAKLLGLQFLIGIFALRTHVGHAILDTVSLSVRKLYEFAEVGSRFIFGNLIDSSQAWGFVFAFKVLPVIIFFGAFMSILFYMGIVQRVVIGMYRMFVLLRLRTSGAETLCALANSFLGQTESPLLIRHYLKDMTPSEMLVVMVSGMATISGSILVVFAAMGVPAQHLLASSVMSIPAAILIAKILYPEDESPKTAGDNVKLDVQSSATNLFDAIAGGTFDGLQLALNVAAMLISFLALIALANGLLGYVGHLLNHALIAASFNYQLPVLSIQLILGYLLLPFGYLLGFTGADAFAAAQLIGTKVAVNELIAYGDMVNMHLSERAVAIITYALCGFSNFSCIGIQIGGIGALVPEKRSLLTRFGIYAVIGGSLANLLCACVAGLLL